MNQEQKNRAGLPKDIWALGLVSLLMDTSSELVHGILPVFLVTGLGASLSAVGLLEGVAEGTSLVLKVFSGPFSDWWGKRKPLVVLGYSMAALSKPLFAMASSIPMVFAARIFDRTGKGIRGAPRDALVADLVVPALRGRAFGLRQSMDTVGACLGPALAIWLMHLFANEYRKVFWLATIPGGLAVAVLVFGVREKETQAPNGPKGAAGKRLRWSDLKRFSPSFWVVVGVGALIQLARFSEAFLILRGRDFGLGLGEAPLVLIVMNVVYAVSAYPLGWLSDRVRREWLLVAGMIVLAAAEFVLGLSQNLPSFFFGTVLWGLQLGLTQGTLGALVADTCTAELRGTAYGVFNLFSAVALLLASLLAGVLWERSGPQTTFHVAAAISVVSLVVFGLTRPFWTPRLPSAR